MKIFIAVGEETLGPYTVEDIQQSILDGDIAPDDLGYREGESEWIPISEILAKEPNSASAKAARNAPTKPQQTKPQPPVRSTKLKVVNITVSEKDHLKNVRQTTCYPELRGVINVITIIAMILLLVLIIISMFPDAFNEGRATSPSPLKRLFDVLPLGLGMIVAIAGRQSAFLLIDIADVLISDSARNK